MGGKQQRAFRWLLKKNMDSFLVSVIVPTYNSAKVIDACLRSVKNQTYTPLEIIIVDNHSTDNTQEIAKRHTDTVFEWQPERSAQRNYGAKQARGEYLIFIDSDMELSPAVIQDCVQKMKADPEIAGIIIPEESFGRGFWAQCKKLERSFYVGVSWMEAARFFRKDTFEKTGGYDEQMISGEDWDLSQRAESFGKIKHTKSFIFHNEGQISLFRTVQKKFYYAQKFFLYLTKNKGKKNIDKQTDIILRFKLFLSQPKQLFRNPLLGLGVLFMKSCEFGFGAFGYIVAKIQYSLAKGNEIH